MKIQNKTGYLSIALCSLVCLSADQESVAGSFLTNSPMATARFDHTATLLRDGKVLVVGGQSVRNVSLSSAELYDPISRMWTNTGSLNVGRRNHTATLLPDGKVLVAGGCSASDFSANAEVYDPATKNWTVTGSMLTARERHVAVLLPNGKVLVAGGRGGNKFPPDDLASVELYDPTSGKWTSITEMNTKRCGSVAILLSNGKVLVVGGRGQDDVFPRATSPVRSYTIRPLKSGQ